MAHLTPNSKVICRVVEITLEGATYVRRKSKPKAVMVPVSLLGKRRFMEKPLSDMRVSEIRTGMHPRKYDFERFATAHASSLAESASTCIDYRPAPLQKRGPCGLNNCRQRIKFCCLGHGAVGCFSIEKNQLYDCHIRLKEATVKMGRIL